MGQNKFRNGRQNNRKRKNDDNKEQDVPSKQAKEQKNGEPKVEVAAVEVAE